MLKITKSTDPIVVKTTKLLIYGQPGTGKTSLAFTASNPLLLDFDNGAYRSDFRKDSVHIEKWADIASMEPADLKVYQTVVVDTVGRLLDILSADIINRNPKMGNRSGSLSMQGWGQLKGEFAQWVKRIQTMGKDLVFIAHDKEDKKGDAVIVRPDVQGGSFGEIFKIADGVGFMHKVGKETVIDFSPCDEWLGKNPAQFETLEVPNFHKEPHFMAEVITRVKSKWEDNAKKSAEVFAQVQGIITRVEMTQGVDMLNKILEEVKEINGAVKVQTWPVLNKKAGELGLKFSAESMQFEPVPAEETEPAEVA